MLKVKENNLELGKLRSGSTTSFNIILINEGEEPVTFVSKVTCGCTNPKFPSSKINPNETIEGKCSFKAGRRKGKTSKAITFTTNTGSAATLNFSANIT